MRKTRELIIGLVLILGLTACASDGNPEVLNRNKTKVLNLGSLISVSGDTYNITESNGSGIGYKAKLN